MKSKLLSIYELRLKVRKFQVDKTRGTVMFTLLVVITPDDCLRSSMLILNAWVQSQLTAFIAWRARLSQSVTRRVERVVGQNGPACCWIGTLPVLCIMMMTRADVLDDRH